MLQDGFFDPDKPFWVRRGDLPHWRQEGALYFVTFRLSDSLPQVKLDELRHEARAWRESGRSADADDLMERSLKLRRKVELWLDQGSGSCVLRIPEARQIVEASIRFFENERYELGRFTVAPNHVHVLVRTAVGIDLSEVLYSWKRFTSGRLKKIDPIRRIFNGVPHLWQTESFDHIVRNLLELERIDGYIASHEK